MKRELKVRHYGRYVDDFYIVHEDAGYLKSLIPVIRDFLREELHLTLHPRKIHLQRADRGVLFVGGYVKPGAIVWSAVSGRCSMSIALVAENSRRRNSQLR